MGLVAGVVGLNLAFAAAGYALLSAFAPLRPSYAGVAHVCGAGATGVAVFLLAIAGLHVGLLSLAVALAAVAGAGIGAARVLGSASARTGSASSDPRGAEGDPVFRPGVGSFAADASSPRGAEGHPVVRPGVGGLAAAASSLGAAVLLAGLVAVLALVVLGSFRTAPTLDDAWGIWLPKGVALGAHGLDARLFVPNGRYLAFEVPDYPLWWSSVSELNLRVVGTLDVRVMDAQLALLTLAFVGAVARLLWGRVRPWLLAGALLLLVASPQLLRHVQSGGADLVLGIFLALFALGAALWLADAERLGLVVAGVCAAAALAVKTEAAPEVAIVLAVVLVAARRRRRALLGAAAGAYATALPWWIWRAAHDVPERVPLRDALDPSYLADRTGRVGQSASTLAGHLLDPTEWLLVVPLLIVLSLAAARRRRAALAPLVAVALGWAFLMWVYWAAPDDLDYLLGTSAYRTVDPFVLLAAVALPPLAESVLRKR